MPANSGAAMLRAAEVFVFRAPIQAPVRTSFGIMQDRPAVLLRLVDEDGRHGWGEAWRNFSACGAEHRGRLLAETVLPLALNRPWDSPARWPPRRRAGCGSSASSAMSPARWIRSGLSGHGALGPDGAPRAAKDQRRGPAQPSFFSSRAQVSRRVAVRLKTGVSGVLSLSLQK